MSAPLGTIAVLCLVVGLGGCGGGDRAGGASGSRAGTPPARTAPSRPDAPAEARRPAPGAAVRVIRAWAVALRRGDVRRASSYFAVPATVRQASAFRLRTRAAVRYFNRTLPCGGRLERTRAVGRYTVATFLLTERPGGNCGSGVGQRAAAAFLVRRGRIVRWLRVPVPAGDEGVQGPTI